MLKKFVITITNRRRILPISEVYFTVACDTDLIYSLIELLDADLSARPHGIQRIAVARFYLPAQIHEMLEYVKEVRGD